MILSAPPPRPFHPCPRPRCTTWTSRRSSAWPARSTRPGLPAEDGRHRANSTKQGITVFGARRGDGAGQPQLRSLLPYHALPRYYSLAEFDRLSSHSKPHLRHGYRPGEVGVVRPQDQQQRVLHPPRRGVRDYEVSQVLLPVQIFKNDPPAGAGPCPPAPAPAPDAKASDDVALSPASGKSASAKAKAQEKSSSYRVGGARCLALVAVSSAGLTLLW